MKKAAFKSYNQGQITLFPNSLDEKIPQCSPVRISDQIVYNLDITKVFDTYNGGSTSAYHPSMMLRVVLYSCCLLIRQNLHRDTLSITCRTLSKSDHITLLLSNLIILVPFLSRMCSLNIPLMIKNILWNRERFILPILETTGFLNGIKSWTLA